MKIENTTIYSEELLNEVVKALSARYKIMVSCFIGILVIMSVASCILRRGIDLESLMIYGIAILLILFISIFRLKKYQNTMFTRIKVINHKDNVECKYEFDEEKSVNHIGERTNTLLHTDIKMIKTTPNTYIIIYQGGIFSAVSKTGFADSSEQDFCELLKAYMK